MFMDQNVLFSLGFIIYFDSSNQSDLVTRAKSVIANPEKVPILKPLMMISRLLITLIEDVDDG